MIWPTVHVLNREPLHDLRYHSYFQARVVIGMYSERRHRRGLPQVTEYLSSLVATKADAIQIERSRTYLSAWLWVSGLFLSALDAHPKSPPRSWRWRSKSSEVPELLRKTHTTESTPLQYRSHIDLYRGWPGVMREPIKDTRRER